MFRVKSDVRRDIPRFLDLGELGLWLGQVRCSIAEPILDSLGSIEASFSARTCTSCWTVIGDNVDHQSKARESPGWNDAGIIITAE